MAQDLRVLTLDRRGWLQHHNERTRIRLIWQEFFKEWDIVICPVVVTAAFAHIPTLFR